MGSWNWIDGRVQIVTDGSAEVYVINDDKI